MMPAAMIQKLIRQKLFGIFAVLTIGCGGLIANGCASAGGLPSWVNNPYREFDRDKYVVAVGSGRSLDAAKRDALNGIATFLGVEITTVMGVEERATETREEGQHHSSNSLHADESVNQIISQKLSSVVIERAHSDGPTTYVLALLNKTTFLAGLASEAENATRVLGEGMKVAAVANPPSQSMLLNLLATAQRLQALNGHIIALGGKTNPEGAITLRDSFGFLARFDISLAPAAPVAARAPVACDQSDPRLKKAIADSEALLGHSLEIRLNLEQLPKGHYFCDDLFERYIGLIPKDIAFVKERSPAIFGYGAPALKIIDLDYDGTSSSDDVHFDRAKGTLRVVMSGRSYLIPSNVISFAFSKEYESWVIAHFSGADPEKVAVAEYALYLDFLENVAWQGRDLPRSRLVKGFDLADDPKYETILKMLRLVSVAARKDAKIAAAGRDWLAARHDDFGRAYLHNPAPVAKASSTSAFKRAERAWVDWINVAFDGFSDKVKTRILPDMMGYCVPFNNDEGIVWNDLAYPGLKLYDMGFAIIDRWLKAAHPGRGAHGIGDDTQLALFMAVASPVEHTSPIYWNVEVTERRKNWYFHAMRSEALKKRLLTDILARKDKAFTEVAFANILSFSSTGEQQRRNDRRNEWADILFFWRGLETDHEQWKVATHLIAYHNGPAVYDEAVKLWRRYPWTHGQLLYVLAVMTHSSKSVPWDDFGRIFGSMVSAEDAKEFLDTGHLAVSVLPEMWPALGKGWSRAAILVPHLDRFLEDSLAGAYGFGAPIPRIEEVVRKLRAEHASADLSKLHDYFKKRIVEHPSEDRDFQYLLEQTR